MIDSGYLVEFIDKNQIVLALVQSAKKGRLALLSWQDKQMTLPESRVLFSSPSNLNPQAPRHKLNEAMGSIEKKRDDLAKEVNVPELWELVRGEGEVFTLRQLAELLFNQPGNDQQAAALRAIFYDRVYFRLGSQGFEPLSQAQLEQKLLQKEREAEKKAQQEMLISWLKRNLTNPVEEPPAKLVEILKDWVIREDESPTARQAKEMISLGELGGKRQVFDFLVRLNIFKPHEDLGVLRENLSEAYSERQLQEAAGLRVSYEHVPLLEGFFFTIDGEETTDFDDALSFEPDGQGGGRLGVHITSLAALAEGSELDMMARGRATTLYLPDRRVSMLPPLLSEDMFSLKAGQVRPVVSYVADLSACGEIINYSVSENHIKVSQRLTYDEVDIKLGEGDSFFTRMRDLCLKMEQGRSQAGACFLPLPEVVIDIDDDHNVDVKVMERDGPAREMVAETAIMANRLHGLYMQQQGLACLYRVQGMPKDPWQNARPEEIFNNFSKRKFLQRVDLSLKPGMHAGLGIETYAQATSPIRRYLDLLVQRQLLAGLNRQPLPYDAESMLAVGQEVEASLRSAGRVRQARQRYWLLKWLQQNQGRLIPALVLEQQPRSWQILLLPIMFITNIPLQGISSKLFAGQEIEVKILRADPFDDTLRLELA